MEAKFSVLHDMQRMRHMAKAGFADAYYCNNMNYRLCLFCHAMYVRLVLCATTILQFLSLVHNFFFHTTCGFEPCNLLPSQGESSRGTPVCVCNGGGISPTFKQQLRPLPIARRRCTPQVPCPHVAAVKHTLHAASRSPPEPKNNNTQHSLHGTLRQHAAGLQNA